jgi:hypothetical protein
MQDPVVPSAAGASGVQSSAGVSGTPNAASAGAGTGGAVDVAGAGGVGGDAPSAGAGGTATAGSQAPQAGAAGTSPLLDATQTLVPHASWDCGMPEGIPPPALGELVFEAELELGELHDLGQTQYGHRLQLDVTGGTLTGPELEATFMDRGLDYQLTLANGAVEVEQINILQTSDGASILFRACGTSPGEGAELRFVPDFEAPNAGKYAWLNTAVLAGVRELDVAQKSLRMRVYDVSKIPASTNSVSVVDPQGVPDQSWECATLTGAKGAVVYTESVGIGAGSVSVGASKRGNRNIIPITGGTTQGRVQGSVLSGGADYQIIGAAFELDARYTVHTDDDELIIVRNCGPVGALVPVFETRADGPYAFLNENRWLSSDPSVGLGVVNLTIYELQ